MKTAQGSELRLATAGGTVDNAKVTTADIAAENGAIHAVGTVLIPK